MQFVITIVAAGLGCAAAAGCSRREEANEPRSLSEQQESRAVLVPATAERAMPTRVWADHATRSIRRSAPDGSSPTVLIDELEGPYGLSLDAATQQLVFTSSELEVVQLAPVDGGPVTTLRTSFEEGYAIVVDEGTRKVAYGLRDHQILQITQDTELGTEEEVVLHELASPDALHGLALTPDGSALYMGDPVGQMNQKLIVASHNVEPLVFGGGEVLP